MEDTLRFRSDDIREESAGRRLHRGDSGASLTPEPRVLEVPGLDGPPTAHLLPPADQLMPWLQHPDRGNEEDEIEAARRRSSHDLASLCKRVNQLEKFFGARIQDEREERQLSEAALHRQFAAQEERLTDKLQEFRAPLMQVEAAVEELRRELGDPPGMQLRLALAELSSGALQQGEHPGLAAQMGAHKRELRIVQDGLADVTNSLEEHSNKLSSFRQEHGQEVASLWRRLEDRDLHREHNSCVSLGDPGGTTHYELAALRDRLDATDKLLADVRQGREVDAAMVRGRIDAAMGEALGAVDSTRIALSERIDALEKGGPRAANFSAPCPELSGKVEALGAELRRLAQQLSEERQERRIGMEDLGHHMDEVRQAATASLKRATHASNPTSPNGGSFDEGASQHEELLAELQDHLGVRMAALVSQLRTEMHAELGAVRSVEISTPGGKVHEGGPNASPLTPAFKTLESEVKRTNHMLINFLEARRSTSGTSTKTGFSPSGSPLAGRVSQETATPVTTENSVTTFTEGLDEAGPPAPETPADARPKRGVSPHRSPFEGDHNGLNEVVDTVIHNHVVHVVKQDIIAEGSADHAAGGKRLVASPKPVTCSPATIKVEAASPDISSPCAYVDCQQQTDGDYDSERRSYPGGRYGPDEVQKSIVVTVAPPQLAQQTSGQVTPPMVLSSPAPTPSNIPASPIPIPLQVQVPVQVESVVHHVEATETHQPSNCTVRLLEPRSATTSGMSTVQGSPVIHYRENVSTGQAAATSMRRFRSQEPTPLVTQQGNVTTVTPPPPVTTSVRVLPPGNTPPRRANSADPMQGAYRSISTVQMAIGQADSSAQSSCGGTSIPPSQSSLNTPSNYSVSTMRPPNVTLPAQTGNPALTPPKPLDVGLLRPTHTPEGRPGARWRVIQSADFPDVIVRETEEVGSRELRRHLPNEILIQRGTTVELPTGLVRMPIAPDGWVTVHARNIGGPTFMEEVDASGNAVGNLQFGPKQAFSLAWPGR